MILRKRIYLRRIQKVLRSGINHINGNIVGFWIELRLPYYDHPLVEFLQRIPVAYRIDKRKESHINKAILQAVMQDVLPRETTLRKQWGFYMPIGLWLSNELKPLVDCVFFTKLN